MSTSSRASTPTCPKAFATPPRPHYLDGLTDAVIGTITDHVADTRGELTATYLEPLGGAVAEVDPTDTAFWGREPAYGFHIIAGWTDASDDAAVLGWASSFQQAMGKHATGGVYVNLLDADEDDRVAAAYGDNYERLVELKRRWDPDNVFRTNANIVP